MESSNKIYTIEEGSQEFASNPTTYRYYDISMPSRLPDYDKLLMERYLAAVSKSDKKRHNNIDTIELTPKDKKEESKLENDKLLEIYINKTNEDQNQLRNDIRASEERTSSHISGIEERMDKRLDRIEDIISKNQADINSKIGETKSFMWGITITIILSTVAIALSVIFGIASLVK